MQTAVDHNQGEMYYSFTFSSDERRAAETREKISNSEWNEKYQYVARGNHTGPWRNEITPYLTFIMDMAGEDHIREIDIMGTSQGGKTNFALNCIASFTDQDPAEILVCFPVREDVKEFMSDRFIPMLNNSPQLIQYKSPDPDDTATYHVKLTNSAIIYTAWANSISRLAGKSIKYIFGDEIDKWKATLGKETDPVTLIRKRKRIYGDTYKLFLTSTPTNEEGHIYQAFISAQVIYRYWVHCPDCGEIQLMNFGQIKWPEDKTREEIEDGKLAWYECEHCQSKWSEAKRNLAVRGGKWKADKGKHLKKPERVAFHIPGWLSPDVSFTEIALCAIDSKTSRAKLIDLYNDYMAMPFIESEEGESVTEAVLYDRREDYSPKGANWVIPMWASVLTCFIDVQKNRLELETVGWGEGQESCGLDYRQIPGNPSRPEVWGKLAEYLTRKFRHESGIDLKIAIAGVDSGYLAPRVYKFVKPLEIKRVYATKGSSTVGKPLFSFSNINLSRSRKKSLKDIQRINLCIMGTETAKDQLLQWLQMEDHGPGYMHYHTGYPHSYFKGLCSEHAVTRKGQRRWVLKIDGTPNEPLDLRVGNYAMIEALNPDFEKLAIEIAAIKNTNQKVEQTVKRPVVVQGFKRK